MTSERLTANVHGRASLSGHSCPSRGCATFPQTQLVGTSDHAASLAVPDLPRGASCAQVLRVMPKKVATTEPCSTKAYHARESQLPQESGHAAVDTASLQKMSALLWHACRDRQEQLSWCSSAEGGRSQAGAMNQAGAAWLRVWPRTNGNILGFIQAARFCCAIIYENTVGFTQAVIRCSDACLCKHNGLRSS